MGPGATIWNSADHAHPQFQNEGTKGPRVFCRRGHGCCPWERPGGAFLAIASPMHVLDLASFASRLGEAQGSPPRIEYGRGLLIVRLLGVAGRYDAPGLPLLPCRGWTRLINSRGRSRSWGRQFRLPLTGYHRNQRRTLGTLSPRSQ